MAKSLFSISLAAILVCLAMPAMAGAAPGTLDGRSLTFVWAIPFAGILLSIAMLPAAATHFWHQHCGKVSLFWAGAFLLPLSIAQGPGVAAHEVLHLLLFEYVPFITLLGALYVAAGGVHINSHFTATPLRNTLLLAGGAILASFIGTTGAVLLLITVLLRANRGRTNATHVYVFFIFIVGNVGGSLTPLGDPPLFIGFLEGVSFFWTLRNLWLPMLIVVVPLLAMFYVIDWWRARGENPGASPDSDSRSIGPLIEGKHNLVILAGIIGLVLLSASWDREKVVHIADMPVAVGDLVRMTGLVLLGALSWWSTREEVHRANEFDWFPLLEVAKLFFGIFVTIIPAIAIIRAGDAGAAAPLLKLLNPEDQPNDMMYFWVTGILSAFLDNAPTYLIFFNMAGGDANELMTTLNRTLVAISAGAVFMGALTYIGNAPNFMVKAVVERRGVKMPGFFGYMVWSCIFLLPALLLVSGLFL